jgi:hypothetical protein
MIAPGTTVGQFRVEDKLGEGGMGEVWRATDTTLAREVALKVLPEGFADDATRHSRFEREAKLLASLNHANVATLHALEHLDGRHVLVMELVDGEGLDQIIRRGPIAVEEAVPIALQIAEALEAAHEQGIVHRDLKPSNVMLRNDGSVKVLDFGLAKAWEAEDGDPSLSLSPTLTKHNTAAGVILGTAAYMSPEQARGKMVDRRADIWSYGVVLWEMLTGEKLFEGETVSDVLAAVLRADPDLEALPENTPPALHRLVSRCLERAPRQRLQWIGDARIELESMGDEEVRLASDVVDVTHTVKQPKLPWIVAAAAAAVALAVVGWMGIGKEPVGRAVVGIVAPPEGHDFNFVNQYSGSVSVSPDGRWITFSAADEKQNTNLWLRPVGGMQPKIIAGTEGGSFPFWSPDSRQIAFFADDKLKRVALDGSPAVTLCDAPNGRSGGWNSDGVIIFSPTVRDPIHRIPAGGGTPEPVTALDLEKRETTHRWATFLPDGKHFLFMAGSHSEAADSEYHGVWVGELGSDERRLLIRNRGNAVYASGHLMYVREGILMAHPFDPDRLELVGDPRPVVEGVGVDMSYFRGDFAVSPDGTLAFRRGDVDAEAQLHWIGLDGAIGEPVGETARVSGISMAPDGNRAALVISDPETGTDDIWIHDIERDVRTRVTFGRLDEFSPVWSPDGTRIVFSSSEKPDRIDMHVIPVNGGEPELFHSEAGTAMFPVAWSPDGSTLLYNFGPYDRSNQDVWAFPLDGGEPFEVVATDATEYAADFSPDGKWLLYFSDGSGSSVGFVAPFPAADRRWQIAGEPSFGGAWKLENEIFFVNANQELKTVRVNVIGDSLSFGRAVVHGSLARRVGTGDMAPDGRRALVAVLPELEDELPIFLVANWPQTLAER